MLGIDLKGKRAFIAGVADDGGFGFAIAKCLYEAGAKVCVGTWPPAYGVFTKLLERGKFDESLTLRDGSKMEFEKIYALDADYDKQEDIPEELRESRRYKQHIDVSISGVAAQMKADFGDQALDMVVHSLANGPEVKKPLLETSRKGYLAAVGVSAYSYASIVSSFGPLVKPGGSFVALSYMAAARVIPFYGGGMSSAKAALESDTRVLAYEAGRKWGHRVNSISAGPYNSRAAGAIGPMQLMIDYASKNSPLTGELTAEEVGTSTAFLCSPLSSGITGTVVYVDKGYHTMGMTVELANEITEVVGPAHGRGK
ncbi:MAG: enoyl-[acyl-carrier-protein] reductase [Myxococcales bacterium]|nr:enoyl-[acyl-carrier-protein] reductase [Myxococcales bacterium]